ncbi:helix-turn-helix domain-containing protein ['Paenibacillus yunnanensis' Narsing Rao et al. 2020]|uniref:helix-turn-helix domain-containing protein n=1 Tax=Paenibacillus tengchongensis TaxID=2608684 RepID=UPI00124BF097|nr:helix-turn-helix domain-containing protein [Paenibacillus tengchongensis]
MGTYIKNVIFLREYCYVDFDRAIFVNHNLLCALSRIETSLLSCLVSKLGHIVTYDELITYVTEPITPNELHVHMSRIRKKIEDKSTPNNLISVRRVGYILVST